MSSGLAWPPVVASAGLVAREGGGSMSYSRVRMPVFSGDAGRWFEGVSRWLFAVVAVAARDLAGVTPNTVARTCA
jgi:hypothetical protein